jgi:hypothetical protein
MLDNETSEVKALVMARCERTVSMKEEEEVESMLNEHLSELEIKEALRKKSVFSSSNIDHVTNRDTGKFKHCLRV